MKLKTLALATGTVISGVVFGMYVPRPVLAVKLHRVFHPHIPKVKPAGIAAFQAVAHKPSIEYTVVVEHSATLNNGNVRRDYRQTTAQRADGTRVEVLEQMFKYGSAVTKRIMPLSGGLTLVRETLGIKAVIQSPSSDPSYVWAASPNPASNCTVTNEDFASGQKPSSDITVDLTPPDAPFPGAVKITQSNGDANWYSPDLDCANLGGVFGPRNPGDFPSQRVSLVSATKGTPDTALFLVSDKIQEVTLDAYKAAADVENRSLAGIK